MLGGLILSAFGAEAMIEKLWADSEMDIKKIEEVKRPAAIGTPEVPKHPEVVGDSVAVKQDVGWNREICALLKLDEEGSARVNRFYSELENMGFPAAEVHGHITLAHFHDIQPDVLAHWTREFLADKHSFTVRFSKLRRLGSCLVFLVAESPEIQRWFDEYHERFDAYNDPFTSREGGQYTAHTSLSCRTDVEVDEAGFERLQRKFRPFSARINEVQLSEILEHDYRILESFPLAR